MVFFDWLLISRMSEHQGKKISSLIPSKIKEILKRYSKAYKNKLVVNQYKSHLYNLGFTNRTLKEMTNRYASTDEIHLKRLLAWEITLWYANQYAKRDAKNALKYIEDAKLDEKDNDQLRRVAIVEAECLQQSGELEKAFQVLKEANERVSHADIYFALANLEKSIKDKLHWINKAFKLYELNPITFINEVNPVYDDLEMETQSRKVVDNEKVTVIFPVYNAEEGIHIAIQSILSQTWQNIEVIIVDDQSTDNTFNIIKEFEKQDTRIKVLQTPSNGGPYIARNIALQAASGDYVTVNDADDWSHEKKIETQVRHLQKNKQIIANTSEHARLTENLQFYRRGTPGRYIFPNMSSIMFRRKEVLNKLGFWDSVRFAADGEFKRRFLRVFGKDKFVDLATGPLSLPRQSVSSLTGSSAFGYNGFFMGVRKEYVESMEYFYETCERSLLKYDYPQLQRPYPVPEPMWPNKELKNNGFRTFDVILASDFRTVKSNDSIEITTIKEWKKQENYRIGLIQLYRYDLNFELEISPKIREYINGENVQMLVYGEKIKTDRLVIFIEDITIDEQKYIPHIEAKEVHIIIHSTIEDNLSEKVKYLFNVEPVYYPLTKEVRNRLNDQQINNITISTKDWMGE